MREFIALTPAPAFGPPSTPEGRGFARRYPACAYASNAIGGRKGLAGRWGRAGPAAS